MKAKELYSLLNLSVTTKAELPKGVYMPNEIFRDLVQCVELVEGKTKQASARAFAYAYTYICYWLYRYCKWVGERKITQADLKQILGYSRNNKTLDYIIKKNGVLENMGYLTTTTDYPLTYFFNDDLLDFSTITDLKLDLGEEASLLVIGNNKNYKIKYPLKAFHRTQESLEEGLLDGTFYAVENTHQVPLQVFLYCMRNKNIGLMGFYLYSYLKHRNDIFKEGVDISHHKLSEETGVSSTLIDEILKHMKSHNMIKVNVRDFVFDMPMHLRKANTYNVREYQFFGEGNGVVTTRKVYGYVEGQENERGSAAMGEFADNLIASGDVPF